MNDKPAPIISYRFNEYEMCSQAKSAKLWWITYYFITKNGKEIYRHHESGGLPMEVLWVWEKVTGLKSKNEFHSKFGSYVYQKDGIDYVSALIKNGESSITTFITVEEHEKLNEKFGGWNWCFDPKSEAGFSPIVPPHCIINK